MKQPELSFYDIAPNVIAFSTTRHGGCSQGNYGEFNINEHCGDDASAIARNRAALASRLGIDSSRIIMPHQTHGIETRQVAEEFLSLPGGVQKMVLEGVDAVMTDMSGVCIGVSTADCIPVLLHDSEHYAVCAVHAGWRGTVARIVQKAIADMRLAYGTSASCLTAVIGPGISLDAFEVGDEVYSQFAEAGFVMEGISRQMKAAGSGAGYKWHIDLPECNCQQLVQCGLPEGSIIRSGICTHANAADYFSARRLGINSGRIFNGIMLE